MMCENDVMENLSIAICSFGFVFWDFWVLEFKVGMEFEVEYEEIGKKIIGRRCPVSYRKTTCKQIILSLGVSQPLFSNSPDKRSNISIHDQYPDPSSVSIPLPSTQ